MPAKQAEHVMILENRLFEALKLGDTAQATRLCTADDLYIFAAATGNHNPLHLPGLDGDGDGQAEAMVPSAFAASLVAALLGTQLPGPGLGIPPRERPTSRWPRCAHPTTSPSTWCSPSPRSRSRSS